MASSSSKALISIGKVLVSLVVGYLMYSYWSSVRVDEWYYPIGAGLICAVMIYLLLNKLNKGGGD